MEAFQKREETIPEFFEDVEVWRDIAGYEGKYQISSLGQVKTLSRTYYHGAHYSVPVFESEKILRTYKDYRDGKGELKKTRVHGVRVRLYKTINGRRCDKGKWHAVHRLVLQEFVGPCPEGFEACHNNGKAEDNRLENLRWGSHSSNMLDILHQGTNPCVLTIPEVLEIRKLFAEGMSQRALAKKYDICTTTVRKIVMRQSWNHI